MKKISWDDVHLDYVMNVMDQDPMVIKEMMLLLGEIEMLTFICDVDVVVCESLCLNNIDMGNTLKGI